MACFICLGLFWAARRARFGAWAAKRRLWFHAFIFNLDGKIRGFYHLNIVNNKSNKSVTDLF